MKSIFIGVNKIVLNKTYSRDDVGYKNIQCALMRINENEKIGFFNLGEKYDNWLTKNGFLLNPRKDLNNDDLVTDLNRCTTYLFLRSGNKGLYYYVGTSKQAKRHNANYLLIDLNISVITDVVVKRLGGLQPLP